MYNKTVGYIKCQSDKTVNFKRQFVVLGTLLVHFWLNTSPEKRSLYQKPQFSVFRGKFIIYKGEAVNIITE